MNAFAFAGLARVIFAFAEPQPPVPPPTPLPSAEQSQLSHSQTPNSSPTQKPVFRAQEDRKSEEYQSYKNGTDSATDWIPALTLAIAITTIVQAIIAGIQARHMRRTRRSYEKGERAALWVEEFKFPDLFINQSTYIAVKYDLVNTGNTSANVYAHQWSLRDDFLTDDDLPPEPPYEAGDSPVHFTIPAGKHYSRGMGFERNSLKNLAEVRAGKRWLYLFGYIRYRDAFDDSHTLRVAIKLRPDTPGIQAVTDRPNYNIDT